MLKKIRVDQVRLGMHLHSLEGAWMDHPFWKTRFVIREPEQLKKLQESAIKEVLIDLEKGLDVLEAPIEAPVPVTVEASAIDPAPAAAMPARPAEPRPRTSTPVPPPSRSFDDE